jgi:hypothetical protein
MVNIEPIWDDPWRSLLEGHVRHLALVLHNDAPASDCEANRSKISITLQFWTSDYAVVNAAQTDNPGDLPRDVQLEEGVSATTLSVPLTSAGWKLVIIAVEMPKRPGLRAELKKIGLLRTDFGKEIPLEIHCEFSQSGKTVFSVLALGVAAELATRKVLKSEDITRLTRDLSRCAESAGRPEDAAEIARMATAATSPSLVQELRTKAALLATELGAALWEAQGGTAPQPASAGASGAPYDIGLEQEFTPVNSIKSEPEQAEALQSAEKCAENPATIPESIRADWEVLERRYSAAVELADGKLIVRVKVARHPVQVGLQDFPKRPPTLRTSPELRHSFIRHEGMISGLSSLKKWNRTLGLAHVLNELEREWGDKPPLLVSDRSLLARLRGWLGR